MNDILSFFFNLLGIERNLNGEVRKYAYKTWAVHVKSILTEERELSFQSKSTYIVFGPSFWYGSNWPGSLLDLNVESLACPDRAIPFSIPLFTVFQNGHSRM